MPNISLVNIVLVVFILYRVIKRQLTTRVLRFKVNFYVILLILGIGSIVDAIQKHQITITLVQAITFSIGSLLSAVVFGLFRAHTYHIWVNDQALVVRKGNVYTLLLYLGMTLFVQRGGLWLRARNKYPSEIKNNVKLSSERRHHEK